MSFSHKVDLHISKSNSGSESPKDRTESRRTEFAKRFETTTKTQENLKRIKETLAKAGTQKIDASTQELLYYKTLINNLEDEK
jgi:vacuolar-type H+-ATPase subunit I/STV1